MNLTLPLEITLGAITVGMQYLRKVLTRISNTQNLKCIQTLIHICHLWIQEAFSPFSHFHFRSAPNFSEFKSPSCLLFYVPELDTN